MREGDEAMKLLKVSESCGYYRTDLSDYSPIDKISKDDLMRLVDLTLNEQSVEFDDYDENALKNLAHQVIYKSIVQKLRELRSRRQAFKDASARLFLEEYERYRNDSTT